MDQWTSALIRSLRTAPLLCGDLPEAAVFDRTLFGDGDGSLNYEQKLGHLYEDALELLIRSAPRCEYLASHLQVKDGTGRTLGEIDFLLRDTQTRHTIHLELAVKFYLAVEGPFGWQFPGPDPKDNWERKLKRLRNHQLRLSSLPSARAELKQRFDVDSVDVKQLVYGCIFFPMRASRRIFPVGMSPQCRVGHWLYMSEWDEFFKEVVEVLLIPKPLWPVELNPSVCETLEAVSVPELFDAARKRCVLFTLKSKSEPLFIVPDNWQPVGCFR